MTPREIGWAAGFMEEDGSFGFTNSTPRCVAGQKTREPLDRLQRLFGGKVCFTRKGGDLGRRTDRDHKYPKGPMYHWAAYGRNAIGCMFTLYTDSSQRRRAQIRKAVAHWTFRPFYAGDRTHCPQGHAYSGSNLYITTGQNRQCRACGRVRALKHYHKTKKLKNILSGSAVASG